MKPLWTNLRMYLLEAALLGTFMVSACTVTAALEYPASPIRGAIDTAFARRAIIGIAMGVTAVLLIYSPWGRRSGAHMNPAVTLGFLRLGRIGARDAAGYVAAQFVGGAGGVALMAIALGPRLMHASVNYVATVPGRGGALPAWLGEFAIALLMMTTVLQLNRFPSLAPYTGWFAGALVALYITFEAPLSGMSLNPARTFGSAVVGQVWTALWIYFTAPTLGMLAAVELHRVLSRRRHALCAKLSHCTNLPCVFKCDCLGVPNINAAS
jgi:aquaporin Z